MQLPDDPILRELLPEFVRSWQEEAVQIMHAAQAHNEGELYRLGHTLKGSSLQFGLTDIAEVGIQLMECARRHCWEDVPALYERLCASFQNLQHMLEHTAGG